MGIECRALAMGSLELSGQAPSEIHLLPLGKWDGYIHPVLGQMSFEVTSSHVKSAVDYHKERKSRGPKRDLVIDYEHATLRGGPAPAAGWMPELEQRENGLWAKGLSWNDAAKLYIEKNEYRYISPVFAFDVQNKVTGQTVPMAVFNAGLTNEPFFDELEPLSSKDNSLHKLIFIAKETPNMDELLERLRWFLNVPVSATAQDILDELNKIVGQVKEAISATAEEATNLPVLLEFLKTQKKNLETVTANYSSILSKLELKPEASIEEVTAKIVSAKTNVGTLESLTAELNTMKASVFQKEFDGVIAKGIETGRITPAQKADATWFSAQKAWAERDFKGFQENFTAKAPVIVPLNEIQTGNVEHAANDAEAIARAAQDYQRTEAAAGRVISTTDAVTHVVKQKGVK